MPEGHPAHLSSDLQECSLAILTAEHALNLAQASPRSPENDTHCIHAGALRSSPRLSERCRASMRIPAEQDFVVCY